MMSKSKKGRKLFTALASIGAVAFLIGVFVFAQDGDPQSPGMHRKNVSKAEWQANAKAKMNMVVASPWIPALKADGTSAAPLQYFDSDGVLMREEDRAKPIVITYTQATGPNGEHDTFAAVSRDDGLTFKRQNLSRMADESSWESADLTPYYGHCVKPVMQVRGRNILIAWTSKYAKGGRPRYSIIPAGDPEDDYIYDNPYYVDDIWGVGGSQGSVDYWEEYDLSVSETPYPTNDVPFSAVWTCRGYIGLGGKIVWFKPERLTSARRDATQVFAASADTGFGVAWQEDPVGLNPGKAYGPGEGWSGAVANNGTDIWYSYIAMEDFILEDTNFVSNYDPDHDFSNDKDENGYGVNRPKALVPMSLPMRITDNEMVNSKNAVFFYEDGSMIPGTGTNLDDTDGDGIPDTGTHRYITEVPGLWSYDNPNNPVNGTGFLDFENAQGEEFRVAVTTDGRPLSGTAAATRVNLNLQKYKKSNGTYSAYAIMAYEEKRGGIVKKAGDNKGFVIEEGKNVIYHTFDFMDPTPVSAGHIVNLPEGLNTDGSGTPEYLQDEFGNYLLDWKGDKILAYENARRPRFVLQGKSGMGTTKTIMALLYREGEEGQGRPADIMMRRFVVTSGGNPYSFNYIQPGFQNVSGNHIVDEELTSNTDNVKVLRWEQAPGDLNERSGANPYEDARAHRGTLKGDLLIIGYTYTPNWAAARNNNDKYDFYIRRSFNGGQRWSTDPDDPDWKVKHTDLYRYPKDDGGGFYEEETEWDYTNSGGFEPARNVSLLKNNFESVIEPRIVSPYSDVPGSPRDEDDQNKNVVYFAYGTEGRIVDPHDDSEPIVPLDLYWSYTADRGQTLLWEEWLSTSGQINVRFPLLGYSGEGTHRPIQEGEAQLREVPSGERMYASYLQEGPDEDGNWTSDIMMRRIIPFHFLPDPWLVFPGESMEIYGTPDFQVEAYDDRPLESVMFYLREPIEQDVEGELVEELADIGYEEMPGTHENRPNDDEWDEPQGEPQMWKLQYNTLQVHDGPFALMTKAKDMNGNVRWTEPVNFIVHNLEIISRLPSSTKNKAGRTMPVKFALRLRDVVDPAQPFVYNDGLVVNVFKQAANMDMDNELLQTFVFGEGVENYRIDTLDEIYIANFDTLEEIAEYVVEIRQLSNDWLLGTLYFETVK